MLNSVVIANYTIARLSYMLYAVVLPSITILESFRGNNLLIASTKGLGTEANTYQDLTVNKLER